MMFFFRSFSGVSHYMLKFTAKYFLHQPQHLWHPHCEGVVAHKSASNVTLEKFSHTHTCIKGDSWILDIILGYVS
jgi:hypothetical protein